MFIYLLRHGIAVERGTVAIPNDDRPLTDEGRDKLRKAGKGLAKIVDDLDLILSSPLVRAHDTATIVAETLRLKREVELCKELLPGSSAKSLFTQLARYRNLGSIMLVGHQPDLGYVGSALLGSESSILELRKGALCCIEVSSLPPRRAGVLHWLLQPKHLRALS